MDWYYAVGGDRKGPVGETDLEEFSRQGVITPQTLVWHEGMANWVAYGECMSPGRPAGLAAETVICAGCGRALPASEVILLEGNPCCAACKPVVIQRLREGDSASNAAEAMRNEYLKHEASVKSVGVLYYIGAVTCVVLGAVMLSMSLGRNGGASQLFGGVLLLLIGTGQFLIGTGLRRLRSWARIPTGILSGLGLLGFPLGTLINGYILYLIFSKKGQTVFSEEYQAVIAQTPHIKYRTSVLVWIFLGLILALMVFGLFAAFLGRSGVR